MSATQATPNRESDDMVRRDPVAELRADGMNMRKYATPYVSTPSLQTMSDALRAGGDAEDIASADALDESMNALSDESAQTDDLSALSRIRGQAKAKADEGVQQLMDKARKEMETMMAKAQTEGAAKFASAADEGEALEIVDTIGTGVSVANVALSIFQDGMDPMMREALAKQGMGNLSPQNALDLGIVAGTNMQVMKWSFMVVVLVPFAICFLVLMYGSICNSVVVCQALGSGAFSAISRILSPL